MRVKFANPYSQIPNQFLFSRTATTSTCLAPLSVDSRVYSGGQSVSRFLCRRHPSPLRRPTCSSIKTLIVISVKAGEDSSGENVDISKGEGHPGGDFSFLG
ncbi:hypothetical protein J1N35_023289 [Gossypium stocksii]|uniref:Uncharacterized protein n=1 Tax=Gossypium stocksii TaxID=47602 RepID=A0A9D4A315_9ROSI|nr:hypothetical protein J1N35_023289 [Gossypium stocksii]